MKGMIGWPGTDGLPFCTVIFLPSLGGLSRE
jgi:hypothetical protein